MPGLGARGFEGLLPEGLPANSAVVLQGPQGPEKYLLANQFLAEGLAAGEGALVVLARTTPEDFLKELAGLGVDARAALREGRLVLVDWITYKSKRVDSVQDEGAIIRSSASLVNLEIAFVEGAKRVNAASKRCVVDLLSPAIKLFGPNLVYDLLGTLVGRLKSAGFTSLFLLEKGMHDETVLSSIHGAFEGAIDLRRLESGGEFKVQVGVLFLGGVPLTAGYGDLVLEEGRLAVAAAAEPPPPPGFVCPVCGAPVAEDAKSCPSCKAEFTPVEAPATEVTAAPPPEPARRKARARRGMTNGLARGGMVNGLARSGMTNGLVNGLARARAGMTNGLTNGSGFTNGLGGRRYEHEATLSRWKIYAIPLLAMALLFAPLLAPSEVVITETSRVAIDGLFTDWTGLDARKVPLDSDAGVLNEDVDLVEGGAFLEKGFLSIYARVAGQVLRGGTTQGVPSLDAVRAFLDADTDASSGYDIGGIGAEWMVVVEGRGGNAERAWVHRFTGPDPLNWSAWTRVRAAQAAAAGAQLEIQVDWEALDGSGMVNVLLQAQRDAAAVDVPAQVLTTARSVVLASQGWLGGASLRGASQSLLVVNLTAAMASASVTAMTLHASGTAGALDVQGFTATTPAGSVAGTVSGGTVRFSFSPPLSVGSATVPVTVRGTVVQENGRTIGLALLGPGDLAVADGVAGVSPLGAGNIYSFLGDPPAGFAADGRFGEWTPRPDGMSTDDFTGGKAELDLEGLDAVEQNGEALFYVETAGRLLRGTGAPEPNSLVLPPAQGPSSAPRPEPQRALVRGVDRLRVYIDRDNDNAGFFYGGLHADLRVEVLGRGGRVLGAPALQRYSGGQWVPVPTSQVEAINDFSRMEIRARFTGAETFPDRFGVFVDLSDWRGASDGIFSGYEGRDAGTRGSGTPGTRGDSGMVPMFSGDGDHRFLVTGTGDYQINDQTDKISFRFTTKGTVTANSLRAYASAVTGGDATYRIGVQADSSGNPDGSYLTNCQGTVSGTAAVGWITVALAACSLTTGIVRHLVVSCSNNGADKCDTDPITIRYTTPNNQKYPVDATSDSNMNVLTCTNTGCSWTVVDAQPVFYIGAGIGTSYGSPFHTSSVVSIDATNGRGNKFTVASDRVFNRAEFYVQRTGSATGTLDLVVRNLTDSVNAVTASMSASSVGASFGWITYDFADTQLSSSKTYAIYLIASSGGSTYETYVNTATNAAAYTAITFDGTTTKRADPSAYTDVNYEDIPFYLFQIPEYDLAIFPAVGVLAVVFLLRRRRQNA